MVAVMLASVLLTPMVGFAQTDGDGRFCTNLDRIEELVLSKLSDRTDNARDTHSAQVDRYTELKGERIADLTDRRNDADQKWEDRIEKLRDGATDEQLVAIDVFVGTVEALAKERRTAVDEAIDVFEAAVKDLRDERTEAFNDLLDRYKSAIADAFDEAEASCDAGEDPSEIRTELRSDLTTLREAFKTERENYSFREDFRQLQADRKEATAEAREVFQSGFSRAVEILKEAFSS